MIKSFLEYSNYLLSISPILLFVGLFLSFFVLRDKERIKDNLIYKRNCEFRRYSSSANAGCMGMVITKDGKIANAVSAEERQNRADSYLSISENELNKKASFIMFKILSSTLLGSYLIGFILFNIFK